MDEFEVIQHQKISGLTVFINTVDYRTPHFHPEWELIWVLDQPLAVTCQTEQEIIKPGQIVLFAPNEPHEFHKIDTSCTFLCLQLSSAILPFQQSMLLEKRWVDRFLCDPDIREIKNTLRSVANSFFTAEKNYELFCLGQSILILHKLLNCLPVKVLTPSEASSLNKRNARLQRLLRFVDKNYMHKIRLSDFARQEDCSVSYLSHFIKETTNQTFQEYVNTVRFNCACKLIAAGGMRMLDVCMESGFSDYRYFTRAFRHQFGMTPEAFSKQAAHVAPDHSTVHRSLHSMERFYSAPDSVQLLNKYC